MVDVQKGPFWVIADSFDDDNGVDETAILCFPVHHSTEPTPSHIDAWQKVCGEYKRMNWNYYPRGRVEICRGKATVYANPICFRHPQLENVLRNRFNLGNIEITYKADNSSHYQYGYKNRYRK